MTKMTISETRNLVLKMMKEADLDTVYEQHAQKTSQAVPKYLWMLCRIYASGKKNNNQEMWKFALSSLLDEGYILLHKGKNITDGITLTPISKDALSMTAFLLRC